MWGVFTAAPIQAGEPIVEYVGELVRMRVVDERQKKYEKQGNNGSYIFRLDDEMCIDATNIGGIARYINHSCSPNCDTRIIQTAGQSRVVICARRYIQPYEELTYDYRLPYETKDKAIECNCGSEKCRKWLNWNGKDVPISTIVLPDITIKIPDTVSYDIQSQLEAEHDED